MTDDDNPFSRWSRRKRRVAEEDAREVAVPPPAEDIPEPETDEEESALLEQLGLPVPETLTEGDDFSAFLKAGVPEFLRKRALRVLWRSNPVLANLDGLNDYDDDFTSPELTQKVLATAYKVGRGFLRDPDALKPAADVDSAEADEVDPSADGQVEEAMPNDTSGLPNHSDDPIVETSVYPEDDAPDFRPRRMRFDTSS
ncbi:MAG: DUF3306 domain-containing protein [Silicimonas sp.]|nr:DUF3306 domain-containing protein [Silicimonas sp.]NNL73713.1 DUF3306 domain-containing protein [Silicimonas sp.]